jgi:hypothetical protein
VTDGPGVPSAFGKFASAALSVFETSTPLEIDVRPPLVVVVKS